MECPQCHKPLPDLLIAGAMRCRQCGCWTSRRRGRVRIPRPAKQAVGGVAEPR